jgi:hypothetical protein
VVAYICAVALEGDEADLVTALVGLTQEVDGGALFRVRVKVRVRVRAGARVRVRVTLAAFMRLSAMLPEASTTKMTSEPALRAIFLARTSLCSMYTPFFLAGLATC